MNVMGVTPEDVIDVSIIFLLALGESNKQLNILQNLMQVLPNQEALVRIKMVQKKKFTIYQSMN